MLEVNAYQSEKCKRAYSRQGFDKVQEKLRDSCNELSEACEGCDWEFLIESMAKVTVTITMFEKGLEDEDRLNDYRTTVNKYINKEWKNR